MGASVGGWFDYLGRCGLHHPLGLGHGCIGVEKVSRLANTHTLVFYKLLIVAIRT